MRRSAYRIRDQIWDVYYRLNIRDAISFVDQVGQQTMENGRVASRARQEAGRQALSRESKAAAAVGRACQWTVSLGAGTRVEMGVAPDSTIGAQGSSALSSRGPAEPPYVTASRGRAGASLSPFSAPARGPSGG